MNVWLKRALGILVVIAVGLALARSFRPSSVLVDAAEVARRSLAVTVDDDGRTRVRERYTISAPVAGQLLRTALRPGDTVIAGKTLVAVFAPLPPNLLDARTRREAEARAGRAEAALHEAEAREEQARADQGFASQELVRMQELRTRGFETEEALQRAMRDARRADQGLQAGAFAVQVARHELELAQAQLEDLAAQEARADATEETDDEGGRDPAARRLLLRSPINGRVLRVHEESARSLAMGTPILEVGSTGALEVVAEYLSQDAVRVEPGMRAEVFGWSGDDESAPALPARVRVVEPGGFTKVSALGVEEQRVNIVLDPDGDAADWSALGDGYRVEVRIVLWESDDSLVVPTGALYREGGAWRVLVIEEDLARERVVDIGKRNGLEAEVLDGLVEGDRVILYPSELVADGTGVEVR